MFRNNWLRFGTSQKLLVTYDPNEFEKQSVEVGGLQEIADHFRGNEK